ncbi:hypothetical protein OIE66_13675 [Nonomuraea sp. NBC_01738]|uniref:hypothetical protein n=1 Tax=Nonomuraea sp. NBC_01738 TaxID=2976003 RepID=UPI002E0D8E6F|nr:hypothetical protein OIE66_13675 [Nonomuraea sp. NBC_01738]
MARDQFSRETRKGVDKLLHFSGNVGGLSEDDVLAVLGESGITTLEALVQHALAVPPPAQPQPLDHAMLLTPVSTAVADVPLKQRPPQVAVIVDGVEYDPGDITRFDGQMLTFVADGSPDRILAYTDDRPLRAAVWVATTLGAQSPITPASADSQVTQGEVQMFEHHFYDGDWFWCGARQGWSDLTNVRHGSWPGSDWNDTISSAKPTDCLVYYYEHINYGGIALYAPPGIALDDLQRFGWNDRISSVANHGNGRR